MTRASRVPGRLLAIAACGGAALITAGLTAANSVEPSGAGDGSAPVVRYVLVGAPAASLAEANPREVESVTFTLNPAPSLRATVRVKVGSGSSVWHECPPTGQATLTCLVPGTSAFSADELRVVVAD